MSEPIALVDGRDGVRLAVYDLGGEGPVVIALHAASFCATMLRPAVRALTGRRVLGVDLVGHGRSTKPDGVPLGWSRLGDDVLVVLDVLDLDHVDVVGHSAGGTAAILALGASPSRFGVVACYEPIAPGVAKGGATSGLIERTARRRSAFADRDEARAHLSAREPFASMPVETLDAYCADAIVEGPGGARLTLAPEDEAAFYAASRSIDVSEQVARGIDHLALGDGGDPAEFGTRSVDAICQRWPSVERATFHGLGHLGPLTHPDVVGRWWASTLAGTPRA